MTAITSTAPAPHLVLGGTAAVITSARRAVVARRYAVDSFTVQWRELSQLESIVDDWRELAARALVPNVFYEPAFALAAAPVFGRDVGAVLVWSGTAPRKLLGFFPARLEARRYGLKLPMLVGWTHPFAPFSVPLVEREAAEPVIAAWLAHVAGDTALPGLLLLPYLPEEGPFAASLAAILRRAQMPAADFNRHARALLAPRGNRSAYVEHALGPHQFRELRRTARRLNELGALLFTTATEPDPVAAATEDFFALEASGWKGETGAAAATNDEVRSFIKAAMRGLAAERKVAINRVFLDGRPIAVAITLRSGDTAWLWKAAYDETLARYSPGVMLAASLTEELVNDASIERTDFCATANHRGMNRTWSERLALCDLMIAARPNAPFARAQRLEALRSTALTAAGRLRGLFGCLAAHR
jgi:CelD/BcsL family acetyltransferase involved in cellulose biosynthesis